MKILLILVTSILLTGCAGKDMPAFPDIKKHYLLMVFGGMSVCNECDILNKIPYKIGNCHEVSLKECDLVGGYKPEDSTKLYNWLVDVKKWAEKQEAKSCMPNGG